MHIHRKIKTYRQMFKGYRMCFVRPLPLFTYVLGLEFRFRPTLIYLYSPSGRFLLKSILLIINITLYISKSAQNQTAGEELRILQLCKLNNLSLSCKSCYFGTLS